MIFRELSSYLQVDKIQSLLDSFRAFSQWPSRMIDKKGILVAESGWKKPLHCLCGKGEGDLFFCNSRMLQPEDGDYTERRLVRCASGITMARIPLIVDEQFLGILYSGRFFTEEPDYGRIRSHSRCSEEGLAGALKEIPRISPQEADRCYRFLLTLADIITDLIEESYRRQQAEDGFRGTFLSNPSPIGITELETGKYHMVNRAWEQTLGYTQQEAFGKTSNEMGILPVSRRNEIIGDIRKTGRPIFTVMELTTKEGIKKEGFFSSQIITIGPVRYLCSIFLDATEQRRAERALQQSEEKYRYIAEHTADILWMMDLNMNLTYVSASVERILGYTVQEALGFNLIHISNPPSMDKVRALITHNIALEGMPGVDPARSISFEMPEYRKDGSQVWMESQMSFMRDSGGAITGFIGVSRETTERMKAEMQRKEAEQALRKSEKKYRELYQNMLDPFCKTDMNYRIVECNNSYASMLGYTEEELKKLRTIDVTPEKWRARDMEIKETQLMPEGHSSLYEKEYMKKDGTIIPIELRLHLVTDDNGNPSGIWAIIRDISKRKLFEEELVRARNVAETANRAKSEFLANMSHEIRTPMNGIICMTELVLQTELDEQQREFLTLVSSSSQNLLKIINSILDLSRIEQGKMALVAAPFSLRRILSDTLTILSRQALQKGLEFTSSIDEDIPDMLSGDALRLTQVLINIIGNAVKFTEKGTIRFRAESAARSVDRIMLRFSVSDTGCGIAEEKQQIIFENFIQGDSSSKKIYGGAGLGLTISREIVGLMNGFMEVSSTPGKGSTFTFAAEFLISDTSSLPHERKAPVQSRQTPHSLSVLVCEDEPINRRAIKEFLQREGCRVSCARSGKEAVASVQKEDFDLILMDIQMPLMDGVEATRIIRDIQKDRGKRSYITALTAYAMKEEKERFAAAGMDGYISKPLDFAEIRDLLRDVAHLKE